MRRPFNAGGQIKKSASPRFSFAYYRFKVQRFGVNLSENLFAPDYGFYLPLTNRLSILAVDLERMGHVVGASAIIFLGSAGKSVNRPNFNMSGSRRISRAVCVMEASEMGRGVWRPFASIFVGECGDDAGFRGDGRGRGA